MEIKQMGNNVGPPPHPCHEPNPKIRFVVCQLPDGHVGPHYSTHANWSGTTFGKSEYFWDTKEEKKDE